jgi:hypothetical protein
MSEIRLESLHGLKSRTDGQRVTFRAKVLRLWEVGGLRMVLIGDESALVRVDIGDVGLEENRSYTFRDALVKTYPGGWHSLSLDGESRIVPLDSDVPISQTAEYVERTYKILSGIHRKKGRAAGRVQPWRHPAAKQTGEG